MIPSLPVQLFGYLSKNESIPRRTQDPAREVHAGMSRRELTRSRPDK